MSGFDYNKFKEALNVAKMQKYEELKDDINKTKAFVEKMLTLSLESNSNISKATYHGIDL